MGKTGKRWISICLVLAMLASLAPTAFAAEENEIFPEDSVVETEFHDALGTGEEEFSDGAVSGIFMDNDLISAGIEEQMPDGSMSNILSGEDGLGSSQGEEVFPDGSLSQGSGSDNNLGLVDDETNIDLGEVSAELPSEEAASGGENFPAAAEAAEEDRQSIADTGGEAFPAAEEPEEDGQSMADGGKAFPAAEEPEEDGQPAVDANTDSDEFPAADEPDAPPVEDGPSMDVPGSSPEAAEDAGALQEYDVPVTYAASLTASVSSVTVQPGGSYRVTMTVRGYSGSVYLQYGCSNTSAYRCSWGSWSGNSIPITITGSSTGSGYVYVYLKSSGSNTTLATARISVVVCCPTLTASASSVSIKRGYTSSVTLSYSGYSGSVYLQYGSTNTSAYTCVWGGWTGNSIPLKITGKQIGSGNITVYLKTAAGATLATKTISVSVVSPENPKITLSATSASIATGSSVQINASYSGYSGSVYLQYSSTNTTSYSCSWGGWSGSRIPLTIRGNQSGTGTVRVYLKSVSGTTLASASITVSVYQKQTPKLTASVSSLSLTAGNSSAITFTVSGVSGTYYLQYQTSNASAYSCSWGTWSGNQIRMTVTGRNEGSGSIRVYVKDLSGTTLTSALISPVKVTAVKKPSLSASKSSLSLSAGASGVVNITYSNCNVAAYLQYSTTNSTAYTCSWGAGSGNTLPLNITGRSGGSGTVTVYLKQKSNNATLASTSFTVTVTPSGGGGTITLGYGFSNYSKNPIPLSTCQYMFGNTQRANTIYNYNLGNGGVCFGMSTSAGMLSVASEAPTINIFSGMRTRMSDMQKGDYSSLLGLSVSSFVEAMQISQKSTSMRYQRGLSGLASAVKSGTANGRPVVLCIWGQEGGHAIVATGYTETATQMSIKIYDCNYPGTQRTLTLGKSNGSYTSWSYQIFSGTTWGTGQPRSDIAYVTYADYYSVWNRRGSLQLMDAAMERDMKSDEDYNLLCTKEGSFSVYNFANELVAKYVDGELLTKADDIVEIPIFNAMPDGTFADPVYTLYMPRDYYTIEDGTPGDGIQLTLADTELSATVTTDADRFEICVTDMEDIAAISLTPREGEQYSISIGSSREGDPEQQSVEGTGSGKPIGVGFEDGELSLTGEAASANLSMTGTGEDCSIIVMESTGGTITATKDESVHTGGNYLYAITPDSGYVLKDVCVDGVSVGPRQTYCFENITESHTISAEFAEDLSAFTAVLSQKVYAYDGTPKCPDVTVRDRRGNELQAGVDFEVSYMNNTDVGTAVCVITALDGSPYSGMKTLKFMIAGEGIVFIEAAGNNGVDVTAETSADGVLVCAVYREDGRLLGIKSQEISGGEELVKYHLQGLPVQSAAYAKAYVVDSLTRCIPLYPALRENL